MRTTLRLWAPSARSVRARIGADGQLDDPLDLTPVDGGWWVLELADVAPDADYCYLLDDDDTPLPDPRSRRAPAGVHGPSRLVDDAAFTWHDAGWHGRPLAGSVIYELHVGTFTPDGDFDGVLSRLDHLVDLGIDFVELLPVNAFAGSRGWGYDGVGLYAVHEPYGGPDGLKRLVDGCHARGIGAVLDVVYNHLGPEGNYLDRFGPYYTATHLTPWGPAVNYDAAGSDEVRRFVLDNAAMWLRDYHLDGLRLDAVHAIVDTSAVHVLEELAGEVAALSAHLGRELFLIAESDLNEPRVIASREAGGLGMDAQWSDDFHHAVHAVLTGERAGYYQDFGSLADLAAALHRGFVYDGRYSRFRGRRHGRPLPSGIPGHRLLGYLQDHDQVGNRAGGERSAALMSLGRVKIGAALVLTAPFTPMLFMGEEWAASTPWQYFVDFPDRLLAASVSAGRREEVASFGWLPHDVPDPYEITTFRRSVLNWEEVAGEPHADVLQWHRRLLALRRSRPELTAADLAAVTVRWDDDAGWLVVGRGPLQVVCNLSAERRGVPVAGQPIGVLAASSTGFTYRAGTVELDGDSVVVVEVLGA